MTKQIKCPTCLGKGKVMRQIHIVYSPEQRHIARELFRKGVPLRKIGELIGMDEVHPNKVRSLINAKKL